MAHRGGSPSSNGDLLQASGWGIGHFRLMKGPKEETNAFYRCEAVREKFWFCDLSFKISAFTKGKRDARL